MNTAFNPYGVQIDARSASRELNYSCPECGKPVLLANGAVNIAHFRHKAKSSCTFGAGETREHRLAKYAVRDQLAAHPRVLEVFMEKEVSTKSRPDVSCTLISGEKMAFELQRQPQTRKQIWQRSIRLSYAGYNTVWIVIPSREKLRKGLEKGEYRPTEMEKAFKEMYYGEIYAWDQDQQRIMSMTLKRLMGYKEEFREFGGHSYMKKTCALKVKRISEMARFHLSKRRAWMDCPPCLIARLS